MECAAGSVVIICLFDGLLVMGRNGRIGLVLGEQIALSLTLRHGSLFLGGSYPSPTCTHTSVLLRSQDDKLATTTEQAVNWYIHSASYAD